MNAEEYANIARIERDHWYYSGKRALVGEWLQRARPMQSDDVLLDCGAGTGRFAEEMARHCHVLVLDNHDEALRMLATRFRPEQILSLAGDQVPLPDRSLDYVTALDVLEHVPDDLAVVQGFRRLLKPGGVVAVTVPASMALWSDWDVALHHHRRYSLRRLRALFPESDWDIVTANYTNVLVYPAVWMARKSRGLRRRVGLLSDTVRAEDRLPPAWLNSALRAQFVGLARHELPLPIGVSLLLVARRR